MSINKLIRNNFRITIEPTNHASFDDEFTGPFLKHNLAFVIEERGHRFCAEIQKKSAIVTDFQNPGSLKNGVISNQQIFSLIYFNNKNSPEIPLEDWDRVVGVGSDANSAFTDLVEKLNEVSKFLYFRKNERIVEGFVYQSKGV